MDTLAYWYSRINFARMKDTMVKDLGDITDAEKSAITSYDELMAVTTLSFLNAGHRALINSNCLDLTTSTL